VQPVHVEDAGSPHAAGAGGVGTSAGPTMFRQPPSKKMRTLQAVQVDDSPLDEDYTSVIQVCFSLGVEHRKNPSLDNSKQGKTFRT
jgi:hypothetical protein